MYSNKSQKVPDFDNWTFFSLRSPAVNFLKAVI